MDFKKKETYDKTNASVFHYETVANQDLQADQSELAYRNLNSNFFNLEKSTITDKNSLKAWETKHKEIKEAIEREWHRKAAIKESDLLKKSTVRDRTDKRFYGLFTLSEMEVFLKSSDRGGNSDDYNDVATGLELYNRLSQKGETLDSLKILKNLSKSCESYVQKKKPTFKSGKTRKAMISALLDKVNAEFQMKIGEYKTEKTKTFEKFQKEKNEETVAAAFRAQQNLISQVLNGNMEMSDEELAQLDKQTEEVFEEMRNVKVDDNQSPTFCSKFFNTLGWAENKPRIVDDDALSENGEEMKKSPIKKKMYHAIAPKKGEKDAIALGKQLAGIGKNSRMYFGIGRFGKGVYTSARNNDKDATDNKAMHNSWNYGESYGSVQVVMTLNENAKVIKKNELIELTQNVLKKKFPRIYKYLEKADDSSGSGYKDYLTSMASLFGYNTILGDSGITGIDYYVTTDRKALSVRNTMMVRSKATSSMSTDFDSDWVDLKSELEKEMKNKQ